MRSSQVLLLERLWPPIAVRQAGAEYMGKTPQPACSLGVTLIESGPEAGAIIERHQQPDR